MKKICPVTDRHCDHQEYCENHSTCFRLHERKIMNEEPERRKLMGNQAESMPDQYTPRIPEFMDILDAAYRIHMKKSQDYASEANPFSNFERSGSLMSWFKDNNDKAFVSLIGTKLARLAELLQPGRIPNNESIDDTFLDLTTYCALWGAYRKKYKVSYEGAQFVPSTYGEKK